MNPIEVSGLEKAFCTGPVLRGLNLSIPEQSVYGLLGRNGSGKTTLLRVLIGLMHPDSGHAHIFGSALCEGCPPEKASVAYVAQGEILPVWASIADLVRFESALRPNWDPAALDQWLHAESIQPKRRVSEMSVGQRKRLELELALAARPKVILMDEPFAGLDPVSRAEFTEQVLAHAATEGISIILSSHILSDLERMCDRIGIMAKGVIAFEATMDDLKEQAAIVTANHSEAPRQLPVGEARQVAARQADGVSTWILSGLTETEAAKLEADGFTLSRGSLEELGVELLRCLDAR